MKSTGLSLGDYPVDHILPELKASLGVAPSVVLLAPPGAGKTTRVPLFLLDLLHKQNERIIMLEPRRLAAVSAARWMAQLIGEKVGGTVGYTIRFDSCTSPATRIEIVTEGVLTRRIQKNPELKDVAIVIFDEFHERSIHSDIAMSLCIDIRKAFREDLKLLVMSATLDCGPIASLLDNAPVIVSEGLSYPVTERWLPGKSGNLGGVIADAVKTALKETSGDVLVFLPGVREIRTSREHLMPLFPGDKDISIHPLYADLPFDEQEAAILPSSKRKIILATNIAETSLTIEGVGVVIDSGLTRRIQYDPSSGMNRLVTMNVSRASAEQRKGRAGRLGPGVCYRLYDKQTFYSMKPFTPPEILTSDLTNLALELAVWGVHDPSKLQWLDPPPVSSWEGARRLLSELHCLDNNGLITQKGKYLAMLPLHARLGNLLFRAVELGVPELGADLAAILSERDFLRTSSSGGRDTDIKSRIDILRSWRGGDGALQGTDQWALRSVDRTARQIAGLVSDNVVNYQSYAYQSEMIPLLLLSAFPDRIAKKREDGDGRFLMCNGRGVRLSLSDHMAQSDFIVAANVDAGENTEGFVYLSAEVGLDLIRKELSRNISSVRKVAWDSREGRVIGVEEERLGKLVLSSRPIKLSDEEMKTAVCGAVKATPELVHFSREAQQFRARVAFVARVYSEESWPGLTDEFLFSHPGRWLAPWAGEIRNADQLAALDILPALRSLLSWEQQRLLDRRAPLSIIVPSGNRIAIDYTAGDTPVLAVKLQEMFGLAQTPSIAEGRVKLLLHLLSPARRPVQVTADLKGFWDRGYQLVKKELKGRYPKHPWPDDPWTAIPTGKAKPRAK